VALLLAVLSAWVDVVAHLLKQVRPSIPTGEGPDAIWMAPLINLVWLGVPALVLAAAARRWPRAGSPRVQFLVLGTLALFNVVLIYQRVHAWAAFLLALGLSVRLTPSISEFCAAHPRRVSRLIRWTAVAGLVVPLLVAGGRWARERWQLANLPDFRANAPNVILLVLDTVRSFNTSLYGYARPTTPHLARWASRAVRFDAAFATAPWTLPSHAGMFTGRYPGELTADWKVPLDRTFPTLAEALLNDGYATASFVANLSYCTGQYGLTRGFLHNEGYPVSLGVLFSSSAFGRRLLLRPLFRRALGFWNYAAYKRAATVNQQFFAWLDARTERRPFFAFLNYYDAHQPALPPSPFDTIFGPPPRPRPPEEAFGRRDISSAELARFVNQYDGAIRYTDQQLDLLLRELARRGMLDNTIVIVTADHGEHWGDHGRLSHGNTVYRQALQVPLVIRYPQRFPRGYVVEEPVSLRDLPTTVLDLAGVTRAHRFPGASLVPYVHDSESTEASTPSPRLILSGNAPKGVTGQLSLITEGMHYVRDPKTGEELYDFARDPGDSLDLSRTPAGRQALPRLRQLLDSLTSE
jgi:arylsulfatase A-like enzyme